MNRKKKRENGRKALALVDRPPKTSEVERLRLVLSTFQDGTGQISIGSYRKGSKTLPGWRDFERSVALVFNGEAIETKAIFDVLISDPKSPETAYGISCKMRGTLSDTDKKGRVTVELSNSSASFSAALKESQLDEANYKQFPILVGNTVIRRYESLYNAITFKNRITIDVARSSFLVLSYNHTGIYQLHQFPLTLPHPETLKWFFPTAMRKGVEVEGKRLVANDETGTIFEWYGGSGGQLKYYPLVSNALWVSDRFQLEPISGQRYESLFKAAKYFPKLWKDVKESD